MKKTVFFGALTVAGLVAGMASAATLDDVKARGSLNCGVTTGLVGFAAPNAEGEWEGWSEVEEEADGRFEKPGFFREAGLLANTTRTARPTPDHDSGPSSQPRFRVCS